MSSHSHVAARKSIAAARLEEIDQRWNGERGTAGYEVDQVLSRQHHNTSHVLGSSTGRSATFPLDLSTNPTSRTAPSSSANEYDNLLNPKDHNDSATKDPSYDELTAAAIGSHLPDPTNFEYPAQIEDDVSETNDNRPVKVGIIPSSTSGGEETAAPSPLTRTQEESIANESRPSQNDHLGAQEPSRRRSNPQSSDTASLNSWKNSLSAKLRFAAIVQQVDGAYSSIVSKLGAILEIVANIGIARGLLFLANDNIFILVFADLLGAENRPPFIARALQQAHEIVTGVITLNSGGAGPAPGDSGQGLDLLAAGDLETAQHEDGQEDLGVT